MNIPRVIQITIRKRPEKPNKKRKPLPPKPLLPSPAKTKPTVHNNEDLVVILTRWILAKFLIPSLEVVVPEEAGGEADRLMEMICDLIWILISRRPCLVERKRFRSAISKHAVPAVEMASSPVRKWSNVEHARAGASSSSQLRHHSEHSKPNRLVPIVVAKEKKSKNTAIPVAEPAQSKHPNKSRSPSRLVLKTVANCGSREKVTPANGAAMRGIYTSLSRSGMMPSFDARDPRFIPKRASRPLMPSWVPPSRHAWWTAR
mmetsp:Transcript_21034/g.48579  ORF Transcript_21034/g.48579 Transcript_21034/m.48579 type:complete len:260 (-) Transcript_21034:1148-1927(-)